MIKIRDKRDCCGCGACSQKCPQHCISIEADHEGFEYPKVDKEKCVDCGLCVQVCPVINQTVPKSPIEVYAAKSRQEAIRKKSSSGGLFTIFAQQIIRCGGVVFGARFDSDWLVVMDYAEKEEDLEKFRCSKYLQAKIGKSYHQALDFLKQGRTVFYSGTPCQIRGLKLFLGKDFHNLLTMDFACHGVPSPKVWKLYLSCKEKEASKQCLMKGIPEVPIVVSVNFRDKMESDHWEDYHLTIAYKNIDGDKEIQSAFWGEDPYMKLFLSNVIMRPSCYKCPVRPNRSGSDITVADYWSIDEILPNFNDHRGVSVLMLNTEKGKGLLNYKELIEMVKTPYEAAIKQNGGFALSISKHPRRNYFFRHLNEKDFKALAIYTLSYKPSSLKMILALFYNRGMKLIRHLL